MSGIKILFFSLAMVLWLTAAAGSAVPAPVQPDTGPPPATGAPPAEAEPGDIHDIRHPVPAGVNPAVYYGAASGAAALAAAVLIWWLVRRRAKRGSEQTAEVTATVYRDPEEEALADLALLEEENPGRPAEFYFRLSAIFRRYLQRRFEVGAPEMTTEELLPRLADLRLDRETQAAIKTFLRFGDQVKFARGRPDPADITAHLGLVRDLVKRFAPAPPAEKIGGAP